MPLEDHSKALETCTYCPKLCRHACPVSNATGHEALIPQAKMQLLNMLRKNVLGWSQDLADPLFACTGCRLCQQYCEHGVDVAAALWEGRALAQERGLAPLPFDRMAERLRQLTHELQEQMAHGTWGDKIATEARVALLPAFDTLRHSPSDLDDFFFICQRLGLDYVRITDAPLCTSYHLLASGLTNAAQLAAEEMVRHIRNYATLVVGSPACAHLLRVELPRLGLHHNTEVLHVTEFLATHAERIEPLRRRRAVFYHDPCYLGRQLGSYDPPRRLVARCTDTIREFFYSREKGECCGGGGLVPESRPEAALGQAAKRLEEPALFDIHTVITACPTCKRTFEAARTATEILSVENLVAWSMRPAEMLPPHQD